MRDSSFRWMLLSLVCGLPALRSDAKAFRQPSSTPVFDVVSIKPVKYTDGSWGMKFTSTGFTAYRVKLIWLMAEAYGFDSFSGRVVGIPSALDEQLFDIDARMDADGVAAYGKLSPEERKMMLQRMLRERFRVSAQRETRVRNVFLLEVGGKGAKLAEALVESEAEKKQLSLVTKMRPGLVEVERISMEGLARVLAESAGGEVLDRTGLPGRYRFTLRWTPESEDAKEWPELKTALEEQLGLRLRAAKVPVDVVVVSHAELPSDN